MLGVLASEPKAAGAAGAAGEGERGGLGLAGGEAAGNALVQSSTSIGSSSSSSTGVIVRKLFSENNRDGAGRLVVLHGLTPASIRNACEEHGHDLEENDLELTSQYLSPKNVPLQ
eukprot:6490540-Pyramimonas_sp.AAC.1